MPGKIQTGLRLNEQTYEELKKQSQVCGVSVNSLILFYMDVGMRAVSLGVEAAGRERPRIPQDTA